MLSTRVSGSRRFVLTTLLVHITVMAPGCADTPDIGPALQALAQQTQWSQVAAIIQDLSPERASSLLIAGTPLGEFAVNTCSEQVMDSLSGTRTPLPDRIGTFSTLQAISLFCDRGVRVGVLRSAIRQGLDVNMAAVDGGDARTGFAMVEHNDVSLLLLASGALADARDARGTTWLELAVRQGNRPLTIALLRDGATLRLASDLPTVLGSLFLQSLTDRAVRDELVRHLRADELKDAVDSSGRNLFAFGVFFRNLDVVSAGVGLGSSVDLPDNKGQRPAFFAMLRAMQEPDWLPIFERAAEPCSFDPYGPFGEAAADGGQQSARTHLAVVAENALMGDAALDVLRVLVAMSADPGRRRHPRADVPFLFSLAFLRVLIKANTGSPEEQARIDERFAQVAALLSRPAPAVVRPCSGGWTGRSLLNADAASGASRP